MNLLNKILNHKNLKIKLFFFFSFIVTWLSISSSYQHLLIFSSNEEITISKIINFFRIGLIKTIKQHPKSDKLKVLNVKTFDNDDLTIITNLQDLKEGDKHLFAINDAFLATGIIINNSKVMGVESQGMICSYKSIGIEQEGIIYITNKEITDKYEF